MDITVIRRAGALAMALAVTAGCSSSGSSNPSGGSGTQSSTATRSTAKTTHASARPLRVDLAHAKACDLVPKSTLESLLGAPIVDHVTHSMQSPLVSGLAISLCYLSTSKIDDSGNAQPPAGTKIVAFGAVVSTRGGLTLAHAIKVGHQDVTSEVGRSAAYIDRHGLAFMEVFFDPNHSITIVAYAGTASASANRALGIQVAHAAVGALT